MSLGSKTKHVSSSHLIFVPTSSIRPYVFAAWIIVLVLISSRGVNCFLLGKDQVSRTSCPRDKCLQMPNVKESTVMCYNDGPTNGAAVARRQFLFSTSFVIHTVAEPKRSNALFFGTPKLQLELCLVTILRVKYWADRLSKSLQIALEENNIIRKKELYLESRLGAKALLTGRIGGGGGGRVYTLAKFDLRKCLQDGISWFSEMKTETASTTTKRGSNKNSVLQGAAEEIIYALGALVEFDGLDSITDESPRPSLTMTMFSDDKLNYVKRMMNEKLLPSCDLYLNQFSRSTVQSCVEFIENNYPSEIPFLEIPKS